MSKQSHGPKARTWAKAALAFIAVNEIRGLVFSVLAAPALMSEAWHIGLKLGMQFAGAAG